MNHIGLCKDRAPASHICRLPALLPKADKVRQYFINLGSRSINLFGIQRGGQSLGLLIDKGARSGRAGSVGVKISQF